MTQSYSATITTRTELFSINRRKKLDEKSKFVFHKQKHHSRVRSTTVYIRYIHQLNSLTDSLDASVMLPKRSWSPDTLLHLDLSNRQYRIRKRFVNRIYSNVFTNLAEPLPSNGARVAKSIIKLKMIVQLFDSLHATLCSATVLSLSIQTWNSSFLRRFDRTVRNTSDFRSSDSHGSRPESGKTDDRSELRIVISGNQRPTCSCTWSVW